MRSTPNPRAGEVWDVTFDPSVGHEQGGRRPALVVSGDHYNDVPHELRIVVPITGTDRGVREHVRISPPEGGLNKPSVAMCEQVGAQSLLRFQRWRGQVGADTLERVRGTIAVFLEERLSLE